VGTATFSSISNNLLVIHSFGIFAGILVKILFASGIFAWDISYYIVYISYTIIYYFGGAKNELLNYTLNKFDEKPHGSCKNACYCRPYGGQCIPQINGALDFLFK
jgi:hypothetical protein